MPAAALETATPHCRGDQQRWWCAAGSVGQRADADRPARRVLRGGNAGLGSAHRWLSADGVLCEWTPRRAWCGGVAETPVGGQTINILIPAHATAVERKFSGALQAATRPRYVPSR